MRLSSSLPFISRLTQIYLAAAITTVLCVLSLLLPPSYLGSDSSRLFALQKSGIITILLALVSCLLALITFIVELVVAIPAKNRLGAIPGIEASLVRRFRFLRYY